MNNSVLNTILALEPPRSRQWPDYGRLLAPEHADDLIRIATDEGLLCSEIESPESWAPVHAWRALGQLRSTTAIEPLIGLLSLAERDDWIPSELPKVFAMIGPAAIDPLAEHLGNPTRELFSRASAAESLALIATSHPESRAECVAPLVRVLEAFGDNDLLLNAIVIGCLMDLEAVDAAPVMEAAFQAGRVDLRHAGDWEDVQVELGLLPERLTPRAPFSWLQESVPPRPRKPAVSAKTKRRAKLKSKRKIARDSRRKNRRQR